MRLQRNGKRTSKGTQAIATWLPAHCPEDGACHTPETHRHLSSCVGTNPAVRVKIIQLDAHTYTQTLFHFLGYSLRDDLTMVLSG